MRIAWRGQHQFWLITAVSQPGRDIGRAMATKGDECDRSAAFLG
ncbi:MAG: hypothetical protein V7K88_07955 [Nostoc sp.]